MSENDPFSAFESDRTIIKPTGGRGTRQPPQPSSGSPTPGAEPGSLPEIPGSSGLNPLLQAAAPLLAAAPRIRAMPSHPDPQALRASLIEGVRGFESATRSKGLPNEQVIAGRYVLCTLLDEFASSTPGGGSGAWSSNSLLVHFHGEAWGGEKVFQLMGKLAENVGANRNLLELLYVVLALGFEGRYRVLDNGRAQLETVRERLAQMLRQDRPPPDKELSPHWTGAPQGDASVRSGVPVWVLAVAAAFTMMLVFIGLRLSGQARSDATFATLQALDVKPAQPGTAAHAVPPPAPAPAPRLSGFLKPEIDAGLVEVRDLADRSVVTIRGDGFFEPGSADVAPRVTPLLGRIAQALNEVPGRVLVTGHTDNQPIRSVRFPSNWHLSQERASAVSALLAGSVTPQRLRAEGRADAEPVDDNSTPAGRARNRRVEITLFTSGATS
jgi:type VI secretion system protein ImpK